MVIENSTDTVILLVEDDEDDRMIIGRALRGAPIMVRVDVATNGREALDYLEQCASQPDGKLPDMILLDINMPVMDGNEFLIAIRKHPIYSALPVCVFTTSSDDDVVRAAYDNGANAVVTKVDSLDGMTKVLNTIVEFWFRTAQRYYIE